MRLKELAPYVGNSVTLTLKSGESISGRIVGHETIPDNEDTPDEGYENVLLDFGQWHEAIYVNEIERAEPYDGERPIYYHKVG